MSSQELQVPSFALLEALSIVLVLRLGNNRHPPCLRPFWEVCWGELYGWHDVLCRAVWHDFVEALVSHVLLTGKAGELWKTWPQTWIRVLKKQLPTDEVAAAFLVIRAKLERLQLR